MNTTKLTKTNFTTQVIRYGYFAEQFPSCFSAELLLNCIPELMPLISFSKSQKKSCSKYTTAPTTLSMFKNDVSRRVLSVPNPEAYLRLVKYMSEHWPDIVRFAESKSSLSPITAIRTYKLEQIEILNCESLKEALHVKSNFINGIKSCIRASIGHKYRLKVDIANCYNSMYTHSIAWAVCTKEKAKSFLRTKEPKEIEKDYEIADWVDCLTRLEKNNETNGIIVGPFTSRVVSEIILARIDEILLNNGFKFKRYVDDYKFYFRTEYQAQESIPQIEKVLNEYNLSLNTSKTEIQKYPYEIIKDIKRNFETALLSDGVFGVLNVASQLHLQGEKGAYKYALKYLQDKPLPLKDELQIVLPTLINIMLLDPKYGKYVTDYLKKNILEINTNTLSTVFNSELEKSLKGELQQESLLFIQLIRDLGLELKGENLLGVLKSDNDFAIIIALDLWKYRNNGIKRTKSEAKGINKAIVDLMEYLNGEQLNGSRWLLLYEIKANELVDETLIPTYEINPFFDKMFSLNIKFYKSVKEEK